MVLCDGRVCVKLGVGLGESGDSSWTDAASGMLHPQPLGHGSCFSMGSLCPWWGGAVGVSCVSWGLLDTCPLTDGPQSGRVVLPSPTQACAGVGRGHLPHCNAQLPEEELASSFPSLCSQPPEGEGLRLCSWGQSWDKDKPSHRHHLGWVPYKFLTAMALCWSSLWFPRSACRPTLPTPFRACP